jgi:predicted nucleic acid-binding protein
VGWVADLRGHVVGLDTAPLIYFVEAHPYYLPTVAPFFASISQGEIRAVTSVITLLEVLIHPFRQGNAKLAQQYRDILFNARGLTTVTLSEVIAEEAAKLRATHNLRTPDAISIATAMHVRASHFLTNDKRLPDALGIELLVLDDIQTEPYTRP